MKKNAPDLSMMTHVPLQPQWLAQLPAFQSNDARLVRGCLNMLVGAFHGQPAGTIPNTPEAIATVAQLPLDFVIDNYATLTRGWTVKDTISFLPMVRMAERLAATYGDAIQRLQDGAVVAIAAPDLFRSELLPEQGDTLAAQVGAKTLSMAEEAMANKKIRRTLPENAALTTDLRHFLAEKGFNPNRHDEVWSRFYDFQISKRNTSAAWGAEFRNWVTHQIGYGQLVPDVGPAVGAPPGSPRVTFARKEPGRPFSFGSTPQNRGEQAEVNAFDRLSRAQRHLDAAAAARSVRASGEDQ